MGDPHTLGARLKQLIADHGIKEYELAKRSGVPQSSVHRLIKDNVVSPKYANIEKLARTLGVSPAYLMYGHSRRDENLMDSRTNPGTGGPIPLIFGGVSAAAGANQPQVLAGGTVIKALKKLKVKVLSAAPPVYLYPELSWLEAKHFEKLTDADFIRRKPSAYSSHETAGQGFWLTMKGDAMSASTGLTPTLPEGTKVLFDTGARIKPEQLVLALLPSSDTLTCRLLIEEGDQRYLKPLNPAYPLTQITDNILLLASALESKFSL